jgi:DNA polymerase-3 subunit beta
MESPQFQVKTLLPALARISNVVERRQTLPILSHVLCKIDENHVTLTGTDLEIQHTITIPLPAKASSLSFTVPCRKLLDIIRSLPEAAQIQLKIDKNKRIVMSTEQGQFTFNSHDPDEFPAIPVGDLAQAITLHSSILLNLFNQTSFAIATQDVRYYLTGLLLEFYPKEIVAVATDGHRLSVAKTAFETGLAQKTALIIPKKTVQEMYRFMTDESEVKLSFNNQHGCLFAAHASMACKFIEGQFPPYQQVIPRTTAASAFIEKESFKQSLSRVAIVAHDSLHGVEFSFSPGQLRLFASNPEHEQAEENLSVDFTGEPLDIVLNVQYLIDVINVLPEGMLELRLNDAHSGIVLGSAQAPDFTYVIMPLRP